MHIPTELTGFLPDATTAPAPHIRVFAPASAKANGRALLIFPGGGYAHLAEHEGQGYADWFTQYGYTCFVVTYRLAPDGFRHPAMLEDAAAALHAVRTQAAAFGINPNAIGVIGSSAGGHLAASILVHFQRFPSANVRPDFGILCYPVINLNSACTHIGSRNNLLGPAADPALCELLSCDLQVSPTTPPCFLWHTAEDAAVPAENSLRFAAALLHHKIPCELHVSQSGRHGLGLNAPFDWANAAIQWLDACPFA